MWGRNLTLIIENKVDAPEQPDQCDDLYENYKDEIEPLFLFLTPDGRPPFTATTPAAQRAFKTLSWPAATRDGGSGTERIAACDRRCGRR